MKKGTIILGLVLISILAKGQEKIVKTGFDSETNVTQSDDRTLILNMKLIQRFHNYQSGGSYVSLSDLYNELDSAERIEFLREYRLADLSSESLASIKMRVQQNINDKKFSDDEINNFCMLKENLSDDLKGGATIQMVY